MVSPGANPPPRFVDYVFNLTLSTFTVLNTESHLVRWLVATNARINIPTKKGCGTARVLLAKR
jgi:hypothetical protein